MKSALFVGLKTSDRLESDTKRQATGDEVVMLRGSAETQGWVGSVDAQSTTSYLGGDARRLRTLRAL
jgi:hypothetical protein